MNKFFAIIDTDFHKGVVRPYHKAAFCAETELQEISELSNLQWKPAKYFPERFRYQGKYKSSINEHFYYVWKELSEC